MYEIKTMIIHFSQWLYPWMKEISMAIIATILVLSIGSLNHLLKRQICGMHFIFRSLIFILLCSFGAYAFSSILVYLTPILSKWLASVGMIYLGPLIICVFIALGLVAEKKNQI